MIRIEGTDPNQSSAVRSLLDNKYSNEYDVSGNSADNSFTVTMKPLVVTALEKKTDEEAIETIRDRVDTLGVSEPVIQEYGLGDNEILVELPGISDMDRVKDIIQSTARLEIHAVLGGPFPDEQAALASVGGTLPPDEELVHGSGALTGSETDSVYLLQRVAIVAGSDFRSADPGTDQNGLQERSLHADQRGRRPVLRLHQQERGPQHGRGDGRTRSRSGQHPERDSRLRRDHGKLHPGRS